MTKQKSITVQDAIKIDERMKKEGINPIVNFGQAIKKAVHKKKKK
jgi:hypothetical protein